MFWRHLPFRIVIIEKKLSLDFQRIIEIHKKMVNLIDFDNTDDEDDFSDLMPTNGRRSTALSFTDDPGTILLSRIFGNFW